MSTFLHKGENEQIWSKLKKAK